MHTTQQAIAAFDAAVTEVGVRNVLLADRLRGAFVRHIAAAPQPPAAEMLNGMTEDETAQTASVAGLTPAAQQGEAVAPDDLRERIAAAKEAVDDGDASGCAAILREMLRVLDAQPAAAPQQVAQGDVRDKIIADLRAAHDSAVAQIEQLTTKIAAMSAAAPAGAAGDPVGQWDGAEEWMPLAWALCADECGEEACTELVWEGGPIPEPWGDRWLKYEDEAKRLIALVRKHVPADPPARQALTYDQIVDALVDDAGLNLAFRSYEDDMKFARAIERAHGIGGKGEAA